MESRLRISLLILRLGVFIVMFMWTIDKFVNPSHAAKVFSKYYMFDGLQTNMAYAVGAIQLIIVLAFLVGFKKRFSYGTVLLMHLVSTLTPWQKYLFEPWSNLLFFAAWPMLAALVALYLLRDEDSLLCLSSK